MGIIIGEDTKAIVQGITGKQGSFHTRLMLDFGTRIVAGVTPGKGGTQVHGIPVYDTVKVAIAKHEPDASIIFVPARSAPDAVLEALDNGIKTVIIITEHIPIKDAISLMARAAEANATIIGPNTPGVITPGKGNLGIVSRSGTLTYEIAASLTKKRMGQSTCLGIGGDPVTGLNFTEALELFKDDPQTSAVVIIGEIGGNMEELTAEYIEEERYSKPVVAYVAGRSAPPEKHMGHAGAIIVGKTGTAQSKIEAFGKAGVSVAEKPSDVTELLAMALRL